MNIVPLSPITMVRPPGWPLDQISALKPDGSLILSTGSLSADGAIGGVGCGLRFLSCLLLSTLVASIGLKPGWAASGPAAAIRNAKLPAAIKPRRTDVEMDMRSSPGAEALDARFAARRWPGVATGWSSLAASVGQMAPRAQAGGVTCAGSRRPCLPAPPQARRRGHDAATDGTPGRSPGRPRSAERPGSGSRRNRSRAVRRSRRAPAGNRCRGTR